MRTFLLSLVVVILSGCASSKGFDRVVLKDILSQDAELLRGHAGQNPPQPPSKLSTPFKLAVYLKSTGYRNRPFDWTDADRDLLRTWEKMLRSEGILSEAWFLPASSVQGKQVRDLRLVAARYGADALLIIDGAAAVDRYNNRSAFWYWTIIGVYAADGTHSDALCLIVGTLWDVKRPALYFTEETEGQAQQVGPATLVEDKDSIEQAKKNALDALAKRVVEQLRRLGKPQ